MTPELEKLAKSLEWQPIETVPKDGTRVLLSDRTHNPSPMLDDEWYQDRVMGGFDDWDEVFPDTPPTHWMPLPTGNAGEVIRVLYEALNAVYHRIAISRQMFDAGNIIRDVAFQALPAEHEARNALARAEQLASEAAEFKRTLDLGYDPYCGGA